ncbi:GNAT family N-acetyltransferase [Maricaulis sp.]|uniref:GNAT family N-acetyltransferase n=1 Tax=Maricaulis sp. TaxID=1486257 RepID=UPI0026016558|nr:GNAT family N-acetyltransferase [Maricaulis sp.]
MSALDRPVWQTLTTAHKALSLGHAKARRFLPDVNKFISGPDDAAETMAAVAQLLAPGEDAYILQVADISLPAGLTALKQALGVQMVFEGDTPPVYEAKGIEPLGPGNADEMLTLARLTEPGPFLERTHEMGDFFGIHIDGRLAAMAGTRMRFPGYSEVSGVCSHPDFQGQGLAKRLSAHVAAHILARGERPFLHAWASNEIAVGLYKRLGFAIRCHVNAAIVERQG